MNQNTLFLTQENALEMSSAIHLLFCPYLEVFKFLYDYACSFLYVSDYAILGVIFAVTWYLCRVANTDLDVPVTPHENKNILNTVFILKLYMKLL